MAEISGGEYIRLSISIRAVSFSPRTMWYETILISRPTSSNRRPIKRLTEKTVLSGLVMACRLATWPTGRSPLGLNPTTDGVVRLPSWLAMTVGLPPSMTATTEFVVPRSIPMIFDIDEVLLRSPSVREYGT